MTHDQPESPSGSRAARVWIFLQLFSLTCYSPVVSGMGETGLWRLLNNAVPDINE